ncbi:MAG: RNase adapter RapZ [Oscillospiraceae bacterium]|nr:RNase adapter RapZ [Oscillospiraceae bacterium]
MRFLIITGMSGAGKTQVMHFLEDIGYYCIDNMPPIFISTFAKACYADEHLQNVAIVTDIRSGGMFDDIEAELDALRMEDFPFEVLYLEASDRVLIKRYKETRRSHPLSSEGRIADGIEKEREKLSGLRQRADHIIDTSNLLTRQLKKLVTDLYGEGEENYFSVELLSFGFKYGTPADADLMFDVRFLPNPFYIENLKGHTGLEAAVRDYVMEFPQSLIFLDKLYDMISTLIPYYIDEGKTRLVIAIGCTGGHHRSVTIAEALGKQLAQNGTKVTVTHKDIER